ncbi:DNA polymerase IV [Anaerocolumna cellulosilytica]|uniref:DNA polymerase IV n=1 Tax=Anaerocolumna cellulosilytica TaxID=433286 RepID=A0A6S6QXW5_9FIRM|nr:DNA polymerase IV [Anaerocolumna cellulosilytica]MBB5194221.1 DNA polymerase-4 [Anaerocolumna cellulosilytica]BCJ94566.1 DNA polymerase IV [Anaerocolumna cellulosilytica]
MEKIIFHIDVNSAFLSWEAVYRIKHLGSNQDLREMVSAVGGDVTMRHGIILAKSIPAKKYSIQTGESILEAKQKCPELILVPPNYSLYEKSSVAFMNILREYTPDVEQYSIDEAFIDMTGTECLWGAPVVVANLIKNRIRDELGFTVNIGVSSNKLLAKMASDFKKPDLVHTLFPEEIKDKMWPLPVSELFFVGRATTKKLFNLGIKTIGELANANPNILKAHLKKHGEIVWGFANGYDFSSVASETPPQKGYGNSTTIPYDVTDAKDAYIVLLALAETVSARLRKDNVKAEVIAIGIKDCDFNYMSHQTVLMNATNITKEIYKISCNLFNESWGGNPIRHLGIHTSRLKDYDFTRQMNMFDNEDYEKLEYADIMVDTIRGRYGIDSLKRAVFIKSQIDHMSGGISREKRTVDYDKLKIDNC